MVLSFFRSPIELHIGILGASYHRFCVTCSPCIILTHYSTLDENIMNERQDANALWACCLQCKDLHQLSRLIHVMPENINVLQCDEEYICIPPLTAIILSPNGTAGLYSMKYKFMEALLEAGADVNAIDEWGCSPLSCAIRTSSGCLVDLLKHFGGHRIEGTLAQFKKDLDKEI